MSLVASITGLAATLNGLGTIESKIAQASVVGLERAAKGGEGILKGNASGRPGPRAPTGAYRGSISSVVQGTGTGASAQIGTNAVQGNRLEFGFVGYDRLFRLYNQPPFPHFQPSVEPIGRLAEAEITSALSKALS